MNRHILMLLLLLSLVGCSDVPGIQSNTVREAPGAEVISSTTAVTTPAGCLVLRDIEANAQPNITEDGMIVLIDVTSLDGTIGGTVRYPENGAVWSSIGPYKHPLLPTLCIPQREDVTVKAMVVSVPNTITVQGLNIIG